jgi:putative ABC transport system ATP-binding protein
VIAARIVEGVRRYRTAGDDVYALNSISVEFPARSLTTVVGPSGSGKSTLLHCLAGLDQLTSGEVYLGDVELGRLSRRERALARRTRVGVVFQGFQLHPGLDVARNIALPSAIAGRALDTEWLDQIVHRLDLRAVLGRRPAELSGGEQQRVAAARALAGRPDLVLADEPTGNLDARNGRALLGILRVAVDELERTVILVTHDLASACLGDRAVVINDGRLVDTVAAPTFEHLTRLGTASAPN